MALVKMIYRPLTFAFTGHKYGVSLYSFVVRWLTTALLFRNYRWPGRYPIISTATNRLDTLYINCPFHFVCPLVRPHSPSNHMEHCVCSPTLCGLRRSCHSVALVGASIFSILLHPPSAPQRTSKIVRAFWNHRFAIAERNLVPPPLPRPPSPFLVINYH